MGKGGTRFVQHVPECLRVFGNFFANMIANSETLRLSLQKIINH